MNEIVAQIPDFDIDAFTKLAKLINDFLNHPRYEHWKDIIKESAQCSTQVNFIFEKNIINLKVAVIGKCIKDVQSLDLKGVIKNDYTDFEKMHLEVNKS